MLRLVLLGRREVLEVLVRQARDHHAADAAGLDARATRRLQPAPHPGGHLAGNGDDHAVGDAQRQERHGGGQRPLVLGDRRGSSGPARDRRGFAAGRRCPSNGTWVRSYSGPRPSSEPVNSGSPTTAWSSTAPPVTSWPQKHTRVHRASSTGRPVMRRPGLAPRGEHRRGLPAAHRLGVRRAPVLQAPTRRRPRRCSRTRSPRPGRRARAQPPGWHPRRSARSARGGPRCTPPMSCGLTVPWFAKVLHMPTGTERPAATLSTRSTSTWGRWCAGSPCGSCATAPVPKVGVDPVVRQVGLQAAVRRDPEQVDRCPSPAAREPGRRRPAGSPR